MEASEVTVPRLEDIAASEVINNFYNIQFIVKKHLYSLCYCHYQSKCNAYIISCYPCNFYKSCAIRNLECLVKEYRRMAELKTDLIRQAGYKIIFFEEDFELAFFD